MSTTRFVDGIAALADRYRGFVLDQWGVLHDGRQAYPGAREAVLRAEPARQAARRPVELRPPGRPTAGAASRAWASIRPISRRS